MGLKVTCGAFVIAERICGKWCPLDSGGPQYGLLGRLPLHGHPGRSHPGPNHLGAPPLGAHDMTDGECGKGLLRAELGKDLMMRIMN